MIYGLALLIGISAGFRAMMPLAAISWGAYLVWIDLSATPAAFLGNIIAVIIISLVALGELITDQLPATPSRKVPVQFGARIVLGALTGALLMPANWIAGALLGAIGTYLGADLRARLARAFGRDLPAALIEDLFALVLAFLVVYLA